jgi:hypothetical protein
MNLTMLRSQGSVVRFFVVIPPPPSSSMLQVHSLVVLCNAVNGVNLNINLVVVSL